MKTENHIRSMVKTVTWRILATSITFLLVLVVTKDLTISLEVGVLEITLKMLAYYFHERMWDTFNFGRKKI